MGGYLRLVFNWVNRTLASAILYIDFRFFLVVFPVCSISYETGGSVQLFK